MLNSVLKNLDQVKEKEKKKNKTKTNRSAVKSKDHIIRHLCPKEVRISPSLYYESLGDLSGLCSNVTPPQRPSLTTH